MPEYTKMFCWITVIVVKNIEWFTYNVMFKKSISLYSFTLPLTNKSRALVAVIMKVTIFCDATPSSLVDL